MISEMISDIFLKSLRYQSLKISIICAKQKYPHDRIKCLMFINQQLLDYFSVEAPFIVFPHIRWFLMLLPFPSLVTLFLGMYKIGYKVSYSETITYTYSRTLMYFLLPFLTFVCKDSFTEPIWKFRIKRCFFF